AVSALLVLALTLSVPSITDVTSGKDADPVNTVFTASFGNAAHKLALLVIVLAFISCTLAIQAASARLLFSQGRDCVLPGSSYLLRVSPRFHMSPWSVAVAFVVPSAIILATYNSPTALTKIIDFATVGIYIGFQLVVLAALIARTRGWNPAGAFTLGGWGLPVNIIALAYGVGAIVNLSWPRTPGAAWYDNYIVIVSALAVGGDPRGRGVVATANYVARGFGIHSAMSAAEALRRCPQAVFVRPRHALYREHSQYVWETVRGIVPTVEQTGMDEGYLDV